MAPVRGDEHPVVGVRLAGVGGAPRGCTGREANVVVVVFSQLLQDIRDHFETGRNNLQVDCGVETPIRGGFRGLVIGETFGIF